MSDIFDVVPSSHPALKIPAKPAQDNNLYIRLQSQFTNSHLGYYSNKFIDIISEEAIGVNREIEVLSVHKILKQVIKKYMMSDLELVHFGYVSNALQWKFKSQNILNHSKALNYHCQHLPDLSEYLSIFCSLVAYFVKKYIGAPEQCSAITDLMQKQSRGKWVGIYEEWLQTCPPEMFKLSPRKINLLFTQYTKNCQKQSTDKNYNKMVDQVMELSTTYAMIPGQSKQSKRRKNTANEQLGDTNNSEPFLFGRKILKIDKPPNPPESVSKLFDFNPGQNQSSMVQNCFLDPPQKPRRQIKLGFKGSQQTRVNKHVTDMLKDSPKDMQISKKYIPHSNIGMDGNINFFDSKLFSSGEQIIPYTLRSNSNMYKSKLFE